MCEDNEPLSEWNPIEYVKAWLLNYRYLKVNRSRIIITSNLEKGQVCEFFFKVN